MARRWSPLFLVAVAAAGWLAWRFLPREWRMGCRAARPESGGALGRRPEADAGARATRGRGDEGSGVPAAERSRQAPVTAPAEPALCAAVTRSGARCSREAEPGSPYCWQHAGS